MIKSGKVQRSLQPQMQHYYERRSFRHASESRSFAIVLRPSKVALDFLRCSLEFTWKFPAGEETVTHGVVPTLRPQVCLAGKRFAGLAMLFIFGLAVIAQLQAAKAQVATPGVLPVAPFRVQTITEQLIEGRDISFRRLPTTTGLSQTRIANVVQDGNGFLWFGTQYGLNRYDGYRSRVFRHEVGHRDSLSCVYVHGLFVDHSGVLWVGCDKFLDKFDPINETFAHYSITTNIPGDLSNTIDSIYEDHFGLLWLTTNNGLFRFDPVNARVTRYAHDPKDHTSISENEVNSAVEDRRGRFWIASAGGLDEFDRKTAKVIWHLPLEEAIAKVHEDKSGGFWMIMSFSSSCPVAKLDRESKLVTCYSIHLKPHLAKSPVIISGILESEKGAIWLSSTRGLFKLDQEHKRIVRYHSDPSDAESLESNNIISIFQDQERNIWTCFQDTEPNVFSEEPSPFETFTYQRGSIANPLVTAIYQDHNGTLWIGSMGGLNRIDRGAGTDVLTSGFGVNNEVLCILEDPSHILIGGTFHHEIRRIDPQTGAISPYFLREPSTPIARILFDHKGNLWAATYNGVSRLNRVTGKFITYAPEKKHGPPYIEIKEDSKGILWLGSAQSGLHRFDPQTGHFNVFEHNVDKPNSLSDNRVNSIHFDRSNNTWIGTQNGLDKFDQGTGSFKTYDEQDGLAGNVVSCILEDRVGKLWMSTNRGISSFDPQSRTFQNFSGADGVSGSDLTGWGACYESPGGEMFFGGFNGATAFYPSRLGNNSFAPRIVLTDFELSGKRVPIRSNSPLTRSITYTKAITLSHKQNIFSLEFSALSFLNPTKNRYRYKLEDLQKQWIEVNSENRTASYTTLPTGVYTFRAQGATSRGPWSDPGIAIRIEILPPWWGTWLFRSLCSACILSLVWLGYRYRLHQVKHQYNLRLEERVGERTRIARELHDTLLQGFQGLMFRLQAVRDLLPERPVDAIPVLDIALIRGDVAIAEARDAVQGLRTSATLDDDLLQGLTLLGEELAGTNGSVRPAAFRLLVEGQPCVVNPSLRDDIYGIAREALGNSFHHALAQTIEAEVTFGHELFILRVRDDGRGVDPGILNRGHRAGHWGLNGMRERAKAIGGTLDIWSQPSAGTEVALTIPGSIAYQRSGFKLIRKKSSV